MSLTFLVVCGVILAAAGAVNIYAIWSSYFAKKHRIRQR